jgi:hypothetical protein
MSVFEEDPSFLKLRTLKLLTKAMGLQKFPVNPLSIRRASVHQMIVTSGTLFVSTVPEGALFVQLSGNLFTYSAFTVQFHFRVQ